MGNFVKYMIARRDIEQEIVNVSQRNNHKDAMNWFESMTNYLNGANNILLKIISKLFINNLLCSFNKYSHKKEDEQKQSNSISTAQYQKFEIYPGKKIEKLSSRYFELDCMVKFYVSVKKQFESVMMKQTFESVKEIETFINEKLMNEENVIASKNMMLTSLNMANIK